MARDRKTSPTTPVIVLGLGRFGYAVARSLVALGHEVLAVDEQPDIVQKYASDFTHDAYDHHQRQRRSHHDQRSERRRP